MTAAMLHGFLLQIGLITAIGAQNTFLLTQGVRRQHIAVVCLACALSDALLLFAGANGFGAMATAAPWAATALRLGGVAFMLLYGLNSLRAAWGRDEVLQAGMQAQSSVWATLAACLAITWLNPQVYLDTVVLLGANAAQYPGQENLFAAGATSASFLFFFALGYGARFLRPLLAKPASWRVLHVMVWLMMWGLAGGLLVKV